MAENLRESSAFKSAKSDHKLIDVDVNVEMQLSERKPLKNGEKLNGKTGGFQKASDGIDKPKKGFYDL